MNRNISIIIPSYNSNLIDEVIKSLLHQTASNFIAEILIVGQQENLVINENLLVKYIKVEAPTSAHNRNVGVSHALSEWICFLDSDCLPTENWLERLVSPIDNGYEVIVGAVHVPKGSSFWSWSDHLIGFYDQVYGLSKKTELQYATTSNFLIKKETFLRLHGFNETFKLPAGEDRELCYRIKQEKLTIFFAPNAVVVHHHSRNTLISAWKHIFGYGEATIQFRFLHPKNNFLWQLGSRVARIPFFGELSGMLRVISRAIIRPIKNIQYIKFLKYWPGVFILDFALTLGMIYTLRTYASESQRRSTELE